MSTKSKKPTPRRPAPPTGSAATKPAAARSSRTPAPAPKRSFGGVTIALVIAAVVVVIAVVAVVVTRSSGDASAGPQTYPVTVTGSPLPVMPDSTSTPDPAIGLLAPTLTGQSLFDGSSMTIAPGGGHPMLVVFVAHWCPHCQREVPLLVQWMNSAQKPADLNVVAVSTANNLSDVNSPASSWLKREKWTTPVMADSSDNTAAQAYGLPGYPYLVLLDANGKVTARNSGEMTIDQINSFVKGTSK